MRFILFLISLVMFASCKKNSENLLEKNLSESIHMMSSDLNTLIFSQALIDKFCNEEFFDSADCFNIESDTTFGVVTHLIHFEKENYCDYYSDSTEGTIQVKFDANYGTILDTVTMKYINFKSNGHTFNGEVKMLFLSNVNFSTTVQKILFSDLAVSYNGINYTIQGALSSYLNQQKYKASGKIASTLFDENVEINIVNDIEHQGNYSFTQAVHYPYFLSGTANFKIGKELFTTHYGVNSQNYQDYTKAICIDSTGFRYILPLSKL